MGEENPQRNSVKRPTRKQRFEAFKRDRFTCQYCGAKAPDVVLEVDHILPLCEGGDSDILNLVTSCVDCNQGKGPRLLADDTAFQMKRRQLEEMQDRREQLEMIVEWAEELRQHREYLLEKLIQYWDRLAPGWTPNDSGRRHLRSWLRKFAYWEITEAMEIAADQYIEFEPVPGKPSTTRATDQSWENAFSKISGICWNRKYRDTQKDEQER